MSSKKKKRKKKKKALPTQIELFQSTGSALKVSSFMRSGGGPHEDRKTRRKRTRAAKKDAALKDEGHVV